MWKHNSLYSVITKIFSIQNNGYTAFQYSATTVFFCMQTMASSGKMYIDSADCCTSWTAIIIWSQERLLVRKELLLKPGGPHVHLWPRLHFELSGSPFGPPSIYFAWSALHQPAWLHVFNVSYRNKVMGKITTHQFFSLLVSLFLLGSMSPSGSPSSCTRTGEQLGADPWACPD